MKKVRLKEKDIENLVKKIIREGENREENYMFFQNLNQIKSNIDEMLNMDKGYDDSVLSDGHDWASEHMATSKDDIEEVYQFLKNRTKGNIKENRWDFDWNEHLGNSENEWHNLERDVSACIEPLVDKYSGKFGSDSYGVIDAIYQILEGMFQKR